MMNMNNSEIVIKLKKEESVYIYGAGDVAKEVAYCLLREPYNKKINSFIVSGKPSVSEIFDIPVVSFSDAQFDSEKLIVVAVLEKYRDEILELLNTHGLNNTIALTFESDLWCEVRKYSFEDALYQQLVAEMKMVGDLSASASDSGGYNEDAFKVFVVRSHVDKPVQENFEQRIWEQNIQVGAALTDKQISIVTDATGENISAKNRQYCELTALYWIWKNTRMEYTGLSHYRRRFLLDEKAISALTDSGVDAVVTIPILNYPSVLGIYEKNHEIDDWNVMRQALELYYPEYVPELDMLGKGHFYVAYNMFIMRREWLDRYCEWLFKVLDYCEEHCVKKEDAYQNRYAGFLAERLLSVFLLHHRYEMKIVFSDKHFIE